VLAPEGKRGLIAVASSGFGGANCYAILEAVETVSSHGLIAVGGLAPQQVQSQLKQLKAGGHFDQAALLRGARTMPFRSVAFGDLALPRTWSFSPPALVPQQSGLVMLFSGQGPQHAAMGRALFAHFAAFRDSIKASDAHFARLTGRSLLDEGLFEMSSRVAPLPAIWPIALIQPAVAMLQMALYDLLASLNIKPTILLGHSAGETALLYAVGACTRATTIAIANARGQALSLAEGTGTMAYAHAPLAVVRAEIAAIASSAGTTGGVLELAAFNGPEAQLVSGSSDQVARLVARLKQLKFASSLLRTNTPMHSSLLDVCKARFLQTVQAVLPETPCITQCDYVSTVTGAFVPAGQHITAQTIWANARQPVRFSQAMLSASALAAGPRGAKPPVVLEVTAHPVLASYVEELLPASAVISTLRRCSQPWAEKKSFFDCLGRLLLSGACDTAHWHELAMRAGAAPSLAAVKYPYQRAAKQTQYASVEARKKASRAPPLNDTELYLSQRGSDLADHIVEDSVIFPAAAFVEQALEYGVAEVHDLQVIAAIALPKSGSVRVSMARTANSFTIKTGQPEQERLHCQGVLVPGKPAALPARDLPSILDQCMRVASQDKLPLVEKFGPRFRRIVWTKTNAEQTIFVSLVRGNQPDLTRLDEYCIHPALIDASWQTVAEGLAQHCTRLGDKLIGFYLPSSIARFRSFVDKGGMPAQFYSLGRISSVSRTEIKLDIEAVSESGDVLFVTTGLVCRRVSLLAEPKTHKALSIAWQPHACPYPIELAPDASFELANVSIADRKLVYRALDALAITAAKRTMATRPTYDAARLDRRRHYEWLVQTSQLPEQHVGELGSDTQRRFAPLFEVMRRAMLHQASALLDDKMVISELFAEAHLMTDFYKMTTTLSPAYRACVRLFRDVLLKLAAHGKRVIRVAEIGAGTGQRKSPERGPGLLHSYSTDTRLVSRSHTPARGRGARAARNAARHPDRMDRD
jgi:acyl transferase domain-containing protein